MSACNWPRRGEWRRGAKQGKEEKKKKEEAKLAGH